MEVRLSDVRLNLQGTLRTAALGMSNSLNQVGITLVQIVLNNSLTYYGALSEYGTDIPLAACGIVMKTNAILLAVIIGISLIRFFTRSKAAQGLRKVPVLRVLATPKGTMAVLLGSIIYKFCVQIAINAGLPANMLKFITAALFLVVLVIAGRRGEEIIHA